jgi:hypothetical protein
MGKCVPLPRPPHAAHTSPPSPSRDSSRRKRQPPRVPWRRRCGDATGGSRRVGLGMNGAELKENKQLDSYDVVNLNKAATRPAPASPRPARPRSAPPYGRPCGA